MPLDLAIGRFNDPVLLLNFFTVTLTAHTLTVHTPTAYTLTMPALTVRKETLSAVPTKSASFPYRGTTATRS